LTASLTGGGNTNRSFRGEGEPDGDAGFCRRRISI
jgi:hypothetical protein